MLHKKKEDRPLVVDLVDLFYEKAIPIPLNAINYTESSQKEYGFEIEKGIFRNGRSLDEFMDKLSPLDLGNIELYKKKHIRAFDKKRLIEKNKLGMN